MLLAIPVQPDADTARQWAEQELAKREYQPSSNWLESAYRKFLDLLFGSSGSADLTQIVFYLLLVGILIVAILVGSTMVGKQAASRAGALFTDEQTTAAEYLQKARQAERAQNWGSALVALYRYLVRTLEENQQIDSFPGRTAKEAAVAAQGVFPEQGSRLLTAGRYFDAAFYSEHEITEEMLGQVQELVSQTVGLKARVSLGSRGT